MGASGCCVDVEYKTIRLWVKARVEFGSLVGARAPGAGRQPAAEGAGGREDADVGKGPTGRRRYRQPHQQHAHGQQQVGLRFSKCVFPISANSQMCIQAEKECSLLPSPGSRSVSSDLDTTFSCGPLRSTKVLLSSQK